MSAEELDVAAVVRDILDQARRSVGSGPLFAEQLQQLGVGPEGGRYSESAVSNWIKGRTMPPADVVLAAAKLANISIDERLLPAIAESSGEDGWSQAVEELQQQIDSLHAQIIDICGRLGIEAPQAEEQTTGVARVANG